MATYLWKRYNLIKEYKIKLEGTFAISSGSYEIVGGSSYNISEGRFKLNNREYNYAHMHNNGTFFLSTGFHGFDGYNSITTTRETIYTINASDKEYESYLAKKIDSDATVYGAQYALVKLYSSILDFRKGSDIEFIIGTIYSDYPENGEKNGYWYELIGKISDTQIKYLNNAIDTYSTLKLNTGSIRATSKIKLGGNLFSI